MAVCNIKLKILFFSKKWTAFDFTVGKTRTFGREAGNIESGKCE